MTVKLVALAHGCGKHTMYYSMYIFPTHLIEIIGRNPETLIEKHKVNQFIHELSLRQRPNRCYS